MVAAADNDDVNLCAQASSSSTSRIKASSTSTSSSIPPSKVTELAFSRKIPRKTSLDPQSGKDSKDPIGLPEAYYPEGPKFYRQEPSVPADGPQFFELFRGAKREEIDIEYMTPKGRESELDDLSHRSRTPYGPNARVRLPVTEQGTDTRHPDEVLTEPHDITILPNRRQEDDDDAHLRAVPRHADAGSHLQREATTINYNVVALKWSMWEAVRDIARSPPRLQQCKIQEWKRDIATAQGAMREMEQEEQHM